MTRKALLVGINDYKNFSNLRGCINDVLDTHFSLRCLYGFQTQEIRVLTDQRATKANIIQRLKWLVNDAKAEDQLVFAFSGHGSQIRDRNHDELLDHMDELICPHDMHWDGNYITDDDMNDIFRNLPQGVHLEVIMDCCHSGDNLKEVEQQPIQQFQQQQPIQQQVPGIPVQTTNGIQPVFTQQEAQHVRNRYLSPPTDIFLRYSGDEEKLSCRGYIKGFQERSQKGHILWSSCKSNQVCADAYINGRHHGAFTYFLNLHLRRNPAISRENLLRKVKASLVHAGFQQNPQLQIEATLRNRMIYTNQVPASMHTPSRERAEAEV